jgi:hypothetical protein
VTNHDWKRRKREEDRTYWRIGFLMLFLKSIGVGIMAAISLGVLSFGAASVFKFDAVGICVMPSKLVLPVLMSVIPSWLIYGLVPSGGAAAGILLILLSAILPWTLFFGVFYFAWATLRCRRAMRKPEVTCP